MTVTIPLTQLRPKLPKIMSRISKYFDRYVITRHGKPEAVLLSEEDYDSLIETLDILGDHNLIQGIKKATENLKKKKSIPWEKAKKKLGYV